MQTRGGVRCFKRKKKQSNICIEVDEEKNPFVMK